jgi:hypothetical protein
MQRLVQPKPLSQVLQPEQATLRSQPSAPNDQPSAQAINALAPVAAGVERAQRLETPAGEQPAATKALSVKRLVVTDRIDDREPARNAEFLTGGTQVFAFVELTNHAKQEQSIEIIFEHESGRQVGFVKLPVPKDRSRWRTWGKTSQIKQSGRWVAKVRSANGAELMSQDFIVNQG